MIDDNPDDRALARRVIEQNIPDVHMKEVFDQRGLNEKFNLKEFDIAITDYQLRWTNGLEIVRLLKNTVPDLPIIMFTDSGNEEIAAKAISSGVSEYLVKNSDRFKSLPGVILRVLEGNRRLKEEKEREDKREYLYSLLRHDLKNKVHIVRGYLELMEGTGLSPDQTKLIAKIEKSVKECVNLIDKVRLLTEVEHIEESFEVSVDRLVDQSIALYEYEASKNGIEIIHRPGGAKAFAGFLLKEAVANIIENAIMHSGGKKIIVTTKCGSKKSVVKVEDDGRGVPDTISKTVFDKGVKGPGSSGSGLGIYIVKRIVEEYDGTVELGRSPELGGACFEIRLLNAKDNQP